MGTPRERTAPKSRLRSRRLVKIACCRNSRNSFSLTLLSSWVKCTIFYDRQALGCPPAEERVVEQDQGAVAEGVVFHNRSDPAMEVVERLGVPISHPPGPIPEADPHQGTRCQAERLLYGHRSLLTLSWETQRTEPSHDRSTDDPS